MDHNSKFHLKPFVLISFTSTVKLTLLNRVTAKTGTTKEKTRTTTKLILAVPALIGRHGAIALYWLHLRNEAALVVHHDQPLSLISRLTLRTATGRQLRSKWLLRSRTTRSLATECSYSTKKFQPIQIKSSRR